MSRITLPHNFAPRSYQQQFLSAMTGGKKRAALIWHRRAGKDATTLPWVSIAAMQRVGMYFYAYPLQVQARKAIWDGIRGDSTPYMHALPGFEAPGAPNSLVLKRDENEMRVTLRHPQRPDKPGSIIQIVGSDNVDAFRSTNPVGIVYSEYPQMSPLAWDVCSPILKENGGWAVFCYTPNGQNHGYKLWLNARANPKDWYSDHRTIEQTLRDAPGEDGRPIFTRADYEAELAEGKDEEWLQQEYYCSFLGSTVGSYYGRVLEQHADKQRLVPWNPQLPVYTAWDLGMDDATVIWFCQLPHGPDGPVMAIDYHEDNQKGATEYVHVLKAKPYSYGGHAFPHDGALLSDAMEELGVRPVTVLPRTQSVVADVNTVRTVLPRVYFDQDKCERGISALRNYKKEYDDKNATYKATPKSDWSSHAADAFRMFAVALVTGVFDDTSGTATRQAVADSRFTGFQDLDRMDPESQQDEADYDDSPFRSYREYR